MELSWLTGMERKGIGLRDLHVFILGLDQFILIDHEHCNVTQLNQKEQKGQERDDRISRGMSARIMRNESIHLFTITEITPEDHCL